MALPPQVFHMLLAGQLHRRFTCYAGASVVLYDHLITLAQEKTFIWRKPWTFLSYLYVVTRYVGDAFVILVVYEITQNRISKHTCIVELNVSSRTWWVFGVMSQIILQSRIWALYRCSKRILALCLTFWMIEIGLTTYGQFHVNSIAAPVPIPLNSSTHFCMFPNLRPTTTLWMLPFMSFEIFLFVLAALECSRHIRNLIGTGQWTQRAVVAVIFRDSIIYFFLAMSMYTAILVVGLVFPIEYGVPVEITLAGHVVISTRLTLNLRQAFYRPGSEVTTEWGEASNKPSAGRIAFAANVPNGDRTNTVDSASSGSVHTIGEAA